MDTIRVEAYTEADIPEMTRIWNQVVEEGNAFPQAQGLSREEAARFFAAQSFTGVARRDGRMVGMYILHPNNVGRCGHLCNASYAVAREARGQGAGEAMVRHCMEQGRRLGFRVLQFNAVVAGNTGAIRLYEKLGFVRLGTGPGGFRSDSGYEDIVLFYHTL